MSMRNMKIKGASQGSFFMNIRGLTALAEHNGCLHRVDNFFVCLQRAPAAFRPVLVIYIHLHR